MIFSGMMIRGDRPLFYNFTDGNQGCEEAQEIGPALIGGRRDLGDLLMRQELYIVAAGDGLAAHFIGEVFVGDALQAPRPSLE